MSTFTGTGGLLSLGGIQEGTPLVNGAMASAVATMNVDAASASLYGVICTGDTFTLAGESGSPTHTVTGGPYLVAAGSVTAVTFTPGVAAGGVANDAAITFAANTIANIVRWTLNTEQDFLDTTVMSTLWRTLTGALARWSGTAEAWLDLGDAKQLALADRLDAATPTTTDGAVVFEVAALKRWYGSAVLSRMAVVETRGELVRVTLDFAGNGNVLPDWTA